MRIFNKKPAYTLAEIMVVVLVLTIIFAAFAPFFTKRKLSNASNKGAVWDYADPISLDAYYYPGDPEYTGELFFGVTPNGKDDVQAALLPLAKVVIRSGEANVTQTNKMQRHIQFRYSRTATDDHGNYVGTWFMTPQNSMLGGTYKNMNTSIADGAKYNTAIGVKTLDAITTGRGNTAAGYQALNKITSNDYNTAVGYNAGATVASQKGNTLFGAYAGGGSVGSRVTALGYQAGYKSGNHSTHVGRNAGYSASGSGNVSLGYEALTKSAGSNNIAIGAGALKNLEQGSNNVAIGYNACANFKNTSNKTCIGANSGPRAGTTSDKYIGLVSGTDYEQRTYIGSPPANYGGDAVLEIHNLPTTSPGMYSIKNNSGGSSSNTTTVINGNLIIRGRPYFTVGSTLYHFTDKAAKGYGIKTGDPTYKSYSGSYDDYNVFNQYGFVKITSDRRLKNIGSRFDGGIEELKALDVYNYNFKDDADKKPHVGVIAQYLQKVFPNAVAQGQDGYLRIRWDEMFYSTINAIKALDRKIVAIAERITKVETQISQLEKENDNLKSQVDAISARIQKLKVQ